MVRKISSNRIEEGGIGDQSNSQLAGAALVDHAHQFEEDVSPITLLNGYTTLVGYQSPRLFRVGNLVQLQGVITGPDLPNSTPIIQIDLDYLPARIPIKTTVPARSNPFDGTKACPFHINSAGQGFIAWDATAITWLSLCSLRWMQK